MLELSHPVLNSVVAGHDRRIPLAGRKVHQLKDGGAANGAERDCPVNLKAARAALGVPEDDMCVGNILQGDAARLLETGARRIEQVDDGPASAVDAECGLPQDSYLLDGERARNWLVQGADPRDVQGLA
jgi:hypothetical protein